MKFSLVGTTMVVAAASGVALPTTDSSDSPAHLARAVLESHATTCSRTATDKLIFKAPISTFLQAQRAKNPSMCVWAWDKCEFLMDDFDFSPFCERLNFGYRNTKLQGRFTYAMKTRIDEILIIDMYSYCAQFSGSDKRIRCLKLADESIPYIHYWPTFVKPVDIGTDDRFKKLSELHLMQIAVDKDIEGQQIPQILGHDRHVDDLDAWFGPNEE